MHPHDTEMDLSIGAALYFAARGIGTHGNTPYVNPTRVLLSGLGADELFAGYTRHATANPRHIDAEKAKFRTIQAPNATCMPRVGSRAS